MALNTTRSGPVVTLTLDRPQARNALSPQLLSALIDACGALASDEEAHVVVLRGAGGVFSGGADLLAFAPALASEGLPAADLGRRALDAVTSLPQITVAFADGACVGGGLVLASGCDLRLASAGAWFWLPEVEAGIPVAWGGMAALCGVLGEARTADLVLTGRRLEAEEALRIGLVSEVVADPGPFVERLASKPPSTLRAVKRQLIGLRRGTFDAARDADDLLAAIRDPAVLAAMQAWMTKRL